MAQINIRIRNDKHSGFPIKNSGFTYHIIMIYLSKINKHSGFPVFHGLSSAYTFGDHGCRGKPLRFHPGLVDTALDAHGAETYRLSSTGRGAWPMAGSMDITME